MDLAAEGFIWRLSYYLLLDFLILFHYKERMFNAYMNIYKGLTTKFSFPIWAYLILPIMAIGLEILGTFPRILTGLVLNTQETIKGLGQIPKLISDIISKIFK